MTFWKRENYEEVKGSRVAKDGGGERGTGRAQGIFRAVRIFCLIPY